MSASPPPQGACQGLPPLLAEAPCGSTRPREDRVVLVHAAPTCDLWWGHWICSTAMLWGRIVSGRGGGGGVFAWPQGNSRQQHSTTPPPNADGGCWW